jgi:hypothetical protein
MSNYTSLETIKCLDGHTIIFNIAQVGEYFKDSLQLKINSLSEEDKHNFFTLNQEYSDLLMKLWGKPLFDELNPATGANWIKHSTHRNPTEEYEHHINKPKDEDLSDFAHDLKTQNLLSHKEWYENQ